MDPRVPDHGAEVQFDSRRAIDHPIRFIPNLGMRATEAEGQPMTATLRFLMVEAITLIQRVEDTILLLSVGTAIRLLSAVATALIRTTEEVATDRLMIQVTPDR